MGLSFVIFYLTFELVEMMLLAIFFKESTTKGA
jgi:hypothetical protein